MSKKSMRRGPTSRNERRKQIAAKHDPQRDWFDAALDKEFASVIARLAGEETRRAADH